MSLLLGARGVGAVFGAFGSTSSGKSSEAGAIRDAAVANLRLRRLVPAGFAAASIGYIFLGAAPSIGVAALTLVFAHAGTAAIWTASTTMLHLQTEDRFRGRVFAAELAFAMLSISLSSFVAGRAVDAGVSPRTAAYATGVALLVPLVGWALLQRVWRAPRVVGSLAG